MSTTPSERTQQRRRLLKAAAAAPAIFTLNAGAAPPGAFSSTHCIANTHNLQPPTAMTEQEFLANGNVTDGWVREKVITLDGNNNQVVTYNLAYVDNEPVHGGTCWNSFFQITEGSMGWVGSDNLIP